MSDALSEPTFMELYGNGAVKADEIDDFIDRWHDQAALVDGRPVPINVFLGMTRDEYEAWVHDAAAPPRLLLARSG